MSFEPRYDVTPLLADALAALDRWREIVDSLLLVPQQEAFARRETSTERATSTTRIEGIGVEPARTHGDARAVQTANDNARRAYAFVDYLSDAADVPIDDLVVRQLNREFLQGAPEILTPGLYRRGQNAVGAFNPPDQGDVPALMRGFHEWLRSSGEHSAIVAAIAHVHLVAIHPFWDGNGRTARALSLLVLQRSPYHFRRLLAVERRLLDHKPAYFAALERTLGTRFDPAYGATPWLEFFLPLLASEAASLATRMGGWRDRIAAIDVLARGAALPERARDALIMLGDGRVFTRADYMEATGVGGQTASRDLRRMVEAGLLVASGVARTRTYRADLKLVGT